MWIQYASDGEYTALMELHELIENFDLTNAWHNSFSGDQSHKEDMRRELEERGWYTGYHDFGHYIVLNLDKLQLTSRLQPYESREALEELQARKRMDYQDMQEAMKDEEALDQLQAERSFKRGRT